MKRRIKLTESDLHRIVKESVNKVLKEVKFGGESLHGNNPEDWYALSQARGQRNYNKYGDVTKCSGERKKGLNDYKNGDELADGNDSIRWKGLRKGNKMIDDLDY